jgi:DNA primase
VARIPQHFIDELVARTDIVEVIGSRVQLETPAASTRPAARSTTRKTRRSRSASTSSFIHCFGCGAHGTVLGFLMDYDHLGFIEASRISRREPAWRFRAKVAPRRLRTRTTSCTSRWSAPRCSIASR